MRSGSASCSGWRAVAAARSPACSAARTRALPGLTERDGVDLDPRLAHAVVDVEPRVARLLGAMLLPDVDRAVLAGEFGEGIAVSFREAVRPGVEGWLEDDIAFTRSWGFGLGEISVPAMIWQGSADLMVPLSHGQWLAAQLPGASAHLEAGEGRLSVGLGALDRMLDELVGAATRP